LAIQKRNAGPSNHRPDLLHSVSSERADVDVTQERVSSASVQFRAT